MSAAAEAIPLSDAQLASLVPGIRVIQYKDLAHVGSIEDVLDGERRLVLLYPIRSDADGHWTCGFFTGDVFSFQDSYGKDVDAELVHAHVPEQPRLLASLLRGVKTTFNHHVLQRSGPGIDTCGRHVACRLSHRTLDDGAYAAFLGDDPDAAVTAWTVSRGGPAGAPGGASGGSSGDTSEGGAAAPTLASNPLAAAMWGILDAAAMLPPSEFVPGLTEESSLVSEAPELVATAATVAAQWAANPTEIATVCQWAGCFFSASLGRAGADKGAALGNRLFYSIRRAGQARISFARFAALNTPSVATAAPAGVAMDAFRDRLVTVLRLAWRPLDAADTAALLSGVEARVATLKARRS